MERRVAWSASPMIAIVGLAQLSGLSPVGPPGAAAGSDLDWSEPRPLAECSQPVAARSDRDDSITVAWRVRPVLDTGGTLAGWDLVTSAEGAGAYAFRLPPESAVRGPVGGLLAVASDDGRQSEISLVSPGDGCRQVLATEERVVRQAVIEPGTGAIVYHAVDRRDRSDTGTWRLGAGSTTAPGPSEPVAPPLPSGSADRAEVGRIWTTDLVFAASGGTLAIQSCGEWACRTHLVEIETGTPANLVSADEGPIVGLDGTFVITFGRCAGLPCPLVSTEISSGRDLMLSPRATSATTFVANGRLVVAAVVLEDARPRLLAVDPGSGRRQQLALVDPWLHLVRGGGAAGGGIQARPGAIPAEDSLTGRPLVLDPGSLATLTGLGQESSGPGVTPSAPTVGAPGSGQ